MQSAVEQSQLHRGKDWLPLETSKLGAWRKNEWGNEQPLVSVSLPEDGAGVMRSRCNPEILELPVLASQTINACSSCTTSSKEPALMAGWQSSMA